MFNHGDVSLIRQCVYDCLSWRAPKLNLFALVDYEEREVHRNTFYLDNVSLLKQCVYDCLSWRAPKLNLLALAVYEERKVQSII